MKSIIHLENIQKSYFMGNQGIPVLKGINLDIYKNEYVALMGPSGSGKSTLMNILGCLDSPTAGQYILNEKDVSKLTDNDLAEVRNKNIGFVFQQFNLLPRLSAAENVALPLVYAGIGKKERLQRAKEVLDKVGLADRSHHKPNELSGGQMQRLCIARTIAVNPSIILMDEPCSALDPKSTAIIEDLISELSVDYSILIVTHNMQQASRVSDFTAFFFEGSLIEFGKTEELFTAPKNRQTEDYITGRFG